MLRYIRDHGCKSYDELVCSVLSDLRVDKDLTVYDLCFRCMSWCENYCKSCAEGRIDGTIAFVENDLI